MGVKLGMGLCLVALAAFLGLAAADCSCLGCRGAPDVFCARCCTSYVRKRSQSQPQSSPRPALTHPSAPFSSLNRPCRGHVNSPFTQSDSLPSPSLASRFPPPLLFSVAVGRAFKMSPTCRWDGGGSAKRGDGER